MKISQTFQSEPDRILGVITVWSIHQYMNMYITNYCLLYAHGYEKIINNIFITEPKKKNATKTRCIFNDKPRQKK